MRQRLFKIITVIFSLSAALLLAEIFLRIFYPQPSLYPRWKYSKEYGHVHFRNCVMIHECPGRWRYSYTINQNGYRGIPVPISENYNKKNIIILGDSYSFGQGVNDGYEYPAVLAGYLRGDYNVINMSVAGWGLTQEIRKYYEQGRLYRPAVVILQFCSNDIEENFLNRVTSAENGSFEFEDTNNTINWVKKYMSRSVIQKSQIYNFFRSRLYLFLSKNIQERSISGMAGSPEGGEGILSKELFYIKLLEPFAMYLGDHDVRLIMLSVDKQLDKFPVLKDKVEELKRRGLLNYAETSEWFSDGDSWRSPEGHWNEAANRIIAEKLRDMISR